jgi:hypothetical protein
LLDQKCGNDPVDDLQDGREQFRMCSEQQAKRDRTREHPLAHRHPRDDVIDQVCGGLLHAPGATALQKPRRLQLKATSFSWAQSAQRRRRKPWAKMPQSRKASHSYLPHSGNRPGLKLDLCQEGLEVFLYQLVKGGVFGTLPLVVDAPSILGAPSSQRPCAWLSRWRRLNRFVHRP